MLIHAYISAKSLGGDIMKRSIGLWQLCGFISTSIGGTLLHFLYDLLGEAIWIAPFSGVNESTWEHMKLLFWPMLIFAAVQNTFLSDHNAFWCIKLRGILLGLVMIPIIFYTLNGAFGKTPDWLNITIFFISAAIAYLYETHLFNSDLIVCKYPRLAIPALGSIALMFVIFTFMTPEIPLFEDPLTGNYGILSAN